MKFQIGDEIIQNLPSGSLSARIIGRGYDGYGNQEYTIELLHDHYRYKQGYTWNEEAASVDIAYSFKHSPTQQVRTQVINNTRFTMSQLNQAFKGSFAGYDFDDMNGANQSMTKSAVPECICGGTKMGYKPGRQHSSFMKCPLYKE